MGNGTGTYVLVLILGFAATVTVGQILLRTGLPYLEAVFGDRRSAQGFNRLLSVLFHLVVLGILALISTIDVPVDGALQIVITKLGVVLLVIGIAHGLTLLVLNRMRDKRREQELADEVSKQVERARRGGAPSYQGPAAPTTQYPSAPTTQYPAAPRAATGQVIEGPQR